ncbi:Pre-mRNA splicing factor-domain-containing protein [Chytriomyces cf. hyalinus JEL632]|nr:Pre-mRNA splicing factor-domain-containing protein [Chytriomyces cf. hyalinus JEL632]
MGGGDLNLKKSWHPQTLKNIERVYLKERAADDEKKKIAQKRKEIEEQRQMKELQELHESSGKIKKKQERLDWIYAGPAADQAMEEDREAYLLGKKRIDKLVEQGSTVEEMSAQNTFSATDALIYGANANSARDLQNKIRDDPLLAIKRREQASLQAVINNPLRLKALKAEKEASLQSANKKAKKEKKSKKEKKKKDGEKKHKKSSRRHSSGEDENSDRERGVASKRKRDASPSPSVSSGSDSEREASSRRVSKKAAQPHSSDEHQTRRMSRDSQSERKEKGDYDGRRLHESDDRRHGYTERGRNDGPEYRRHDDSRDRRDGRDNGREYHNRRDHRDGLERNGRDSRSSSYYGDNHNNGRNRYDGEDRATRHERTDTKDRTMDRRNPSYERPRRSPEREHTRSNDYKQSASEMDEIRKGDFKGSKSSTSVTESTQSERGATAPAAPVSEPSKPNALDDARQRRLEAMMQNAKESDVDRTHRIAAARKHELEEAKREADVMMKRLKDGNRVKTDMIELGGPGGLDTADMIRRNRHTAQRGDESFTRR